MTVTQRCVTLARMTRIGRGPLVLIAVLTLLTAGWLTYFVHYGECDRASKYCVVDVAGTRSEVGFEWDSWSFYVSTWNG